MEGGDHRRAGRAALAESEQHVDLVVRVQVIGGLIEEEYCRLLRQQARHRRAALLATRQRAECAIRAVLDAHARQGCADDVQIRGRFATQPADVGMAAEEGGFKNRQRQRIFPVLRQQGHAPGDLGAAQRSEIAAVERHPPARWCPQTRERVQRQALATAIATEHGDELAGSQFQ